jgi:hypothetical protein
VIAASVCVVWSVEEFSQTFTTPGEGRDSLALVAAFHAWNAILAFVAFVPLLVFLRVGLGPETGRGAGPGTLAVTVALGAAAFAALFPFLLCHAHWQYDPACASLGWTPRWLHLRLFIRIALWGALLVMVLRLVQRDRAFAQARHAEQVLALRARQEEAAARLQSLQAQVEPHFLFNTLAHVQRLHATDPPRGRAMLHSLIGYMQAALPHMREPLATLADELGLVRSYIHVQQVRMGERLRFHEDVAPQLLAALVPPVSVLTLAENAIKHGLGPKAAGGTLAIAARAEGDWLVVNVSDDGLGLRGGGGHGSGLANTRARLETVFGPGASLAVSGGDDTGVRATIRVPMRLKAMA